MEHSHIIVGSGSAGSVLANRLSARSGNRVLLLEAGQDTPPGRVPKEIEDTYPGTAYFDPRFHWTGLKVRTGVVSHNDPDAAAPPLRKYEQARVLGGGSSISGQVANRGAPTDYDEWEARGAAGWNWDSVLPFFRKVERDLDVDDEWHGKDGRIAVTRIPPERWPGHSRAAAEAFRLAGFKYLPDQNGRFEDGYFPVTVSIDGTKRVSAAAGYLDAQVRARKNLTISTETQVSRLLFEGMRGELGEYARGLKGHVRLLANTAAATVHLPEVLAAFLVANPNVDVDLDERTSPEVARAVAEGEAEVGIAAGHADLSGLEARPFRTDRLVLIAPPGHALAGRGRIAFVEALGSEFVGLSGEVALGGHLAGHAARAGGRMRTRVRVRGLDAACRMVALGAGVAVLPEAAAQRWEGRGALAVVSLEDPWAERRLVVAVRRLDALPSHARRLAEHLVAAG